MGSTPKLKSNLSPGAIIRQTSLQTWRLQIPAGGGDRYRLAQMDDYAALERNSFPWRPPLILNLRARAADKTIRGTWGFGFWNDPFSFSLGLGGGTRRIPALPNAAWFFFASPPNHLSLYDDLPGAGNLAGTFRSRSLPTPFLALSAPVLPFLLWKPAARLARDVGQRYICQDAVDLDVKTTAWHTYRLEWTTETVSFYIDGEHTLTTKIAPDPPLGFVLWIDNQYAALHPDGRLGYGFLPDPDPAWIEVGEIKINGQTLRSDI